MLNAVQEESDGGGLWVDGSDNALGDIVALLSSDSFVSNKLVSTFKDVLDSSEFNGFGVF